MDRPPSQYSPAQKTFHWLVVALLLVQIPLAYIMKDQPIGPPKLGNYALHKSIGMTIFTVTALRLAWRLLSRTPLLPAATSSLERVAARLTQGLLYFLLFAMPLTGWLNSSAANFPVSVFGLIQLPDLVAPDKRMQKLFQSAHQAEAYLLMALVSLHAVAALWHHFRQRDDVLRAMWPFARLTDPARRQS